MRRVPVRLGERGERSYDVVVGAGVLGDGSLVPRGRAERAFVVSDPEVARRWFERLEAGLRAAGLGAVLLQVGRGEQAKSLRSAEALYQQLAVHGAHRDDLVVALGGGVVGDLAGFVAATYMRGVPILQVPTTLLAQVDAAIGGKVAVNLPEAKNLVGAFHQPVGVIADVVTLSTLPDEGFATGLAEVAKYGFALDPGVLEVLEGGLGRVLERDPEVLEEVVAACAALKAAVVSADERDAGRRLVLNYGHTLGHALERLDGYAGTHGTAVSVGMVFAATLAERLGVARPGLADRHRRDLGRLGLPTSGGGLDPAAAVEAMHLDKKYRGGIRFVLLEDLGRPVVRTVEDDVVLAELERFAGGTAGPLAVGPGGSDPSGDRTGPRTGGER